MPATAKIFVEIFALQRMPEHFRHFMKWQVKTRHRWNMVKINWVHSLPRHYMECQTTTGTFCNNIHAVITNYVYQMSTRAGGITGWFPRSVLRETNANDVGVVGTDRTLDLREAFQEQSLLGGQGMKRCACRASIKQCSTKRFKWLMAGIMCTRRCLAALPRVNK